MYIHTDAMRLMYTNKDVRYSRQARGKGGGGFLSPASWCRWMLLAADPESTLGHYNKERGSTKPGEWRAWEGSYSGTPLGTQPWHSHLSQLHQSYSNWHSCPRRPWQPLFCWYCIKDVNREEDSGVRITGKKRIGFIWGVFLTSCWEGQESPPFSTGDPPPGARWS